MSYSLPPLPYAYDALEPHFDALTMEIQHGKHHQTYVNNLNNAVSEAGLGAAPVEALIEQLENVPESWRTDVRNNGGGHANHSLFWAILSAKGGRPSGEVARAIDSELGGFDAFKDAFTKAAQTRFGSGWARSAKPVKQARQLTHDAAAVMSSQWRPAQTARVKPGHPVKRPCS